MESIDYISITRIDGEIVCCVENTDGAKELIHTNISLKVFLEIARIRSAEAVKVLCEYISCAVEVEAIDNLIEKKKKLEKLKEYLYECERNLRG